MTLARLSGLLLLAAAVACQMTEPKVVRETRVPDPATEEFESNVAALIRGTRAEVLENVASGEGWGRFGMVLHAHKLKIDAVTCYEQAARLDPDDFRWPYLIAILDQARTPEQTISLLRRAQSLRPGYPQVNIRLGLALLDLGRAEEAAGFFESAHEADPENSHALLGLGRVALARGELETARRWLERARWHEKRHREVWVTLVRVYNELGLTPLARRAGQFAADLTGDSSVPDPLLREINELAVTAYNLRRQAGKLIRRGAYNEAIHKLRATIEVLPDDAEVHALLVQALVLTWRDEEARAVAQRASELEPGIIDDSALEDWREHRLLSDRPD